MSFIVTLAFESIAKPVVDAIVTALQSFFKWLGDQLYRIGVIIYNSILSGIEWLYNTLRPYVVPVITIIGTALGYYYLLRKPEVPFTRRLAGMFTTPIIAALIGTVIDKFLPPKIELAKIPPPPPPPLELTATLEAETAMYASWRVYNYIGGPIALECGCELKATYVLSRNVELRSLLETEASLSAVATVAQNIELSSPFETEAAMAATYELT
jgi:hypothetical protein